MTHREWQKLWDAALSCAWWLNGHGEKYYDFPSSSLAYIDSAGYSVDPMDDWHSEVLGADESMLLGAQHVIDFALSKRPPEPVFQWTNLIAIIQPGKPTTWKRVLVPNKKKEVPND